MSKYPKLFQTSCENEELKTKVKELEMELEQCRHHLRQLLKVNKEQAAIIHHLQNKDRVIH
jgi:archaellum component FlaC